MCIFTHTVSWQIDPEKNANSTDCVKINAALPLLYNTIACYLKRDLIMAKKIV